jgi:hypothetical protein
MCIGVDSDAWFRLQNVFASVQKEIKYPQLKKSKMSLT